jgi:hypothetical protein
MQWVPTFLFLGGITDSWLLLKEHGVEPAFFISLPAAGVFFCPPFDELLHRPFYPCFFIENEVLAPPNG